MLLPCLLTALLPLSACGQGDEAAAPPEVVTTEGTTSPAPSRSLGSRSFSFGDVTATLHLGGTGSRDAAVVLDVVPAAGGTSPDSGQAMNPMSARVEVWLTADAVVPLGAPTAVAEPPGLLDKGNPSRIAIEGGGYSVRLPLEGTGVIRPGRLIVQFKGDIGGRLVTEMAEWPVG